MEQPLESEQPSLPLGDVFSRSWGIFTQNFTTILIIVLIVHIPLNAILWAASANHVLSGQQDTVTRQLDLIDSKQADQVDTGALASAGAEMFGYGIGVTIFSDMAGAVAVMALIVMVMDRLEGRETSYRQAFSRSLPRWPAGALTVLLSGVAVIVLYAFFIIPGVIFDIFWTFALQAVVLQGKAGPGALAESYRLVRGRWWRVFLYSLVFGISASVISSILTSVGNFGDNALAVIVVTTVISVVLAYFTIAYTVLYSDLAKREEKHGPQMLLQTD